MTGANDINADRVLLPWIITGCILVLVMILIGGITRLTDSGLSMVEWHLIIDMVPPLNHAEWTEAFAKYQQYPEFREINDHFTLHDFKGIFWWEYIHRLLGRLIGLVFAIPYLWYILKGMLRGRILGIMTTIFLLGCFEGFMGWYMVKSGLSNMPSVSHYRLAFHLVLALGIFGLLIWVLASITHRNSHLKEEVPKWVGRLAIIALVVLVLQVIYGAFVAGLKAGLVYNTFPMMGNEWIPEAAFALKPLWKNAVESLAGVQFIHRMLGIILAGFAGIFLYESRKMDKLSIIRKAIYYFSIAILIQVVLGIFTLLFAVPVWLGIVHQLGAILCYTLLLYLLYIAKQQVAAIKPRETVIST